MVNKVQHEVVLSNYWWIALHEQRCLQGRNNIRTYFDLTTFRVSRHMIETLASALKGLYIYLLHSDEGAFQTEPDHNLLPPRPLTW